MPPPGELSHIQDGFDGFLQMADFLSRHDDVASYIIAGGIKVGLIPVLYGLIVYFVSLILRVIHKPRIYPPLSRERLKHRRSLWMGLWLEGMCFSGVTEGH